MRNNDILLVDGIIDERMQRSFPSDKRGAVFEQFAAEQIVKDYSVSEDDIQNCSVDGRDDGGIDYTFLFINGHLVSEPANFFWPKTNIEIDVVIITSKHHDTFRQAPLDNMVASLGELYDLRLSPADFKGNYNKKVVDFREKLRFVYKKSSSRLERLTFKYYYVSRGNTDDIGDSVRSRASQIVADTKRHFSDSIADFYFVGNSELTRLYRKLQSFSLELPFTEVMSRGERYVVLTRLSDFYVFLREEDGKLRRYLFDSNVRAFMGLNRVNEDICETLDDENSPDFWWLNNGVTILATAAKVIGDSIHLEDIQIVNGLQTSESIFHHFASGKGDKKARSVLIKIIVSSDLDVRDQIIKATNNQTPVAVASLRATDKVQKDIEEVLLRNGFHYARRTNFYESLGIDRQDVIQPLYLAAGFLSLILKQPGEASVLKNKFLSDSYFYSKIFNEKTTLEVWPQIVRVLKASDRYLDLVRSGRSDTEGFLRRWRQLLCFGAMGIAHGDFNFSIEKLIVFDVKLLTDDVFGLAWNVIVQQSGEPWVGKKWKSKSLITAILKEISQSNNVRNIEAISRRQLMIIREKPPRIVSTDFIETVNNLLPEQPWKPGLHLEIARRLKCSKNDVFRATETLIAQGRRNLQKDGVLYDIFGQVVGFDPERVDPETLQLRE